MTPPVPEVIVYSRHGCHLCDVVAAQLERLQRQVAFTWRVEDVDADAELKDRFGDQVPVVFIDGRKAFKYRLEEGAFRRRLAISERSSNNGRS